MLALFLDLEHKLYVWRLYTTFEPLSPMSWGAWILVLVYPALIANLLLRVPGPLRARVPALGELSDRLVARPELLRWIGAMNMIWGGLLGIYTGVLLSALGARPLWNSALLGPLFLVSGLSAAAAFVHLIAPDVGERELLAKADNGFLIAELVFIALFLIGLLSSTEAHIQAAGLLLGGPFSALFWVGVIGLGIVVPLGDPAARRAASGRAHSGRAAAGDRRRPGASFRHRAGGPGQSLGPRSRSLNIDL